VLPLLIHATFYSPTPLKFSSFLFADGGSWSATANCSQRREGLRKEKGSVPQMDTVFLFVRFSLMARKLRFLSIRAQFISHLRSVLRRDRCRRQPKSLPRKVLTAAEAKPILETVDTTTTL